MTSEGQKLMRELIEQTKASKAASFAVAAAIRRLDTDKKRARRRQRPIVEAIRCCAVCGAMLPASIEDELHHLHFRHPEHLGAKHCPCASCRPEGCGCQYCVEDPEEQVGVEPGDLFAT